MPRQPETVQAAETEIPLQHNTEGATVTETGQPSQVPVQSVEGATLPVGEVTGDGAALADDEADDAPPVPAQRIGPDSALR